MTRIHLVRRALAAALAIASCLGAAGAHAQDFPNRPIKLVVGLAAGGASDALARIVAKGLGERLKQPVVVENRVGAGGNVASEFVARSPADGYTLLYTADNHNLNPFIYQNAGYNAQKDFTGVILVSEYSLVLSANSNSRFKTLGDLIGQARKEPGAIFYGSSGVGLPNHLAMERINKAAGVKIAHVPYKGSALSVTDAASGQIPLVMSTMAAAQPFYATQKLTPLAVTGTTRWPSLPDVPTVVEAGYPAAVTQSWMGIVAPAATPKAVVDRLNTEIQAVLADRANRDAFTKLGMGVGGGSAERFNEYLARDLAACQRIVADLNLKIE